ncbi:hypothetical protein GCM10022396_19540 [Flavivirga amylovorans]
MDCKTESSILNNTAIQMLFTEKPSINLSANKIINALIISKNKPKVTTVIGKVRTIKTGFTNRFNIDNTTATIIAVK